MDRIEKIELIDFTDFSIAPSVDNDIVPTPLDVLDKPEIQELINSHQQSLEDTYQKGFDEGYQKAKQQATQTQLHQQIKVLADIKDSLEKSWLPLKTEIQHSHKDFQHAVLTIISDYLQHLGVQHLPEKIEDIIVSITSLQEQNVPLFSWLKICLHPDDLSSCKSQLTPLFSTHFSDREMTLTADKTLAPGECFIEWSDGAIHLDIQRIKDALEDTITQTVPHQEYGDSQ